MSFKDALRSGRISLGLHSARAFYMHMSSREELGFNYSYYTRIEAGKVLPSTNVVNNICSFFDDSFAGHILKSYCSELFPNYKGHFTSTNEVETQELQSPSSRALRTQKELSLKQIAIITKSREHYFLFLTLTLARTFIPRTECQKIVGDKFKNIISEFESVKLVFSENDIIRAGHNEYIFPSAYSDELKKQYRTLDQWDKQLKNDLDFKDLKKKFFLRRTSIRHLTMIQGFLEQLDNLIRISDEIDTTLNNDVFIFDYSLSKGKLPG